LALRLPDSQDLVEIIDRQLRRDPSVWSDQARVARTVQTATELGVPASLTRLALRLLGPFRRR